VHAEVNAALVLNEMAELARENRDAQRNLRDLSEELQELRAREVPEWLMARHVRYVQADGRATTTVPNMVLDVDDQIGMIGQVVERARNIEQYARHAYEALATAENALQRSRQLISSPVASTPEFEADVLQGCTQAQEECIRVLQAAELT
jgi:hypothetical protein